jgi:hypothetical protein
MIANHADVQCEQIDFPNLDPDIDVNRPLLGAVLAGIPGLVTYATHWVDDATTTTAGLLRLLDEAEEETRRAGEQGDYHLLTPAIDALRAQLTNPLAAAA